MSQIGGKMSKFYGETDIVSTDLRSILSNFVATGIYSLFNSPSEKSATHMFKMREGGVKGCFNNV